MERAGKPAIVHELYRQRWRIWIVAAIAGTIGVFHRAAMATMADRIMADFDITAVAFGSLGAAYFYIYAAMQVPSGTLADTLRPRKTITTGLLLLTAGSLIMSMAHSFTVLYLGRIVVAFGASVLWCSILKLITEWFSARELASMAGWSGSITNMGQMIAATPLALLIIWVGWRMSLGTIAILSFIFAIATWIVVRDNPAEIDLPAITRRNGQNIPPVAVPDKSSGPNLAQRFKVVFGNKYIWPLFMLGFGLSGAYTTLFQNWAVIYLMQTYGLRRDLAANYIIIATIGLISGLIIAGFLSDRLLQKRRLPAVLFAVISLICFLVLALWNSGKPPLGILFPLCFFIGLGTGPFPVIYGSVGDLIPPYARGMGVGLANSGLFVGAAIAQPLFGYILDVGWRGEMALGTRLYPLQAFQQGFLLCCTFAALGLIAALLIKETHCLQSYKDEGI